MSEEPEMDLGAFFAACAEFGCKPSTSPFTNGYLDMLPDHYKFAVERGRKNGKPMELQVGAVEDQSFNAWASTVGDKDVIAINDGVLLVAQAMFRVLLSHPFIRSEVGNPSTCVSRVFPHWRRISTLAEDWPKEPLDCDKREELATMLAFGTALQVTFHEFSHIYNGHVDYLDQNLGLRRLIERSGAESGGLTSQTFEWNADITSVDLLLYQALMPRIDEYDVHAWHLDNPGRFGSLEQSVGMSFIIALTVDYLFSAGEDVEALVESEEDHPPSFVRAQYLLRAFPELLHWRAGISVEATIAMLSPYLDVFVQTLGAAFPAISWPVSLMRAAEIAGQYQARYAEEWERLSPEIEKLKRGGTRVMVPQ